MGPTSKGRGYKKGGEGDEMEGSRGGEGKGGKEGSIFKFSLG